jgi:hypothetical protein
MWPASLYHYRKLIGLVGVFSMLLGCASSPGHETFKAEGFRIALPKPGTRVVVRGNHLEAVNQAIPWLNDHQLLVVNRWVDKDLTIPKTDRGEKTELQPQVQDVAHKVGATLVVFVHADETLLDRTNPKNGEHHSMKMMGVEVQGINVETGEMAFGAMAWNSEPLVASKRVVQDLTVLALEKSWKESEIAPPQQEVTPEIITKRETPLMAPVLVEPSDATIVPQPASGETMSDSREQVTVFTEPVSEKVPPAPVATQPETAELSGTSEDPSLGLQVASGALSILYMPLKIVYAGLGGFVGAFVYMLTGGNEQVAQSVWDASLGGTYWVTPDHLQGNEPIRFMGESAN